MFLTPKEICEQYINGTKGKASTPFIVLLTKAIMAGAMIAFGAAGSNVAAHAVDNVGLARLIAAVVFPVGLMMVVLLGAELFTGDCLMAMALPNKDITGKKFAIVLTVVYFGNFIGSLLVSLLVYFSGQLNYTSGRLGAYTIKVALGKCGISPITGITSGILCNILVSAAVLMALCAKDVAGKLLASFFVIMLFVTSGYEHCVANMYYITAGLIAKGNELYTAAAADVYGITEAQMQSLNIKTMIVNNLIPVTIGNIIGGSVCVGLCVAYVSGVYKKAK